MDGGVGLVEALMRSGPSSVKKGWRPEGTFQRWTGEQMESRRVRLCEVNPLAQTNPAD